MRMLTSGLALLLGLQASSVQAADAIGLLKQFDTLRQDYPELIARNLQLVIDATRNRTSEQERRAVEDDNSQTIIQLADALGPVLGPIFADAFDSTGLFSASLPLTATSLLTAYVTVISAPIAKEYFKNERPFRMSDQVVRAPGSSGGGYSFPSGHTTYGYTMMLTMAYLFPERYQEFLTRGSEFGNNRIIVGVHYPMDVIGGRIISQANVAELIGNPLTRLELNLAALELKNYFARKCGDSAAACARAQSEADLFGNYEQNKADYTYRLTYGFTGTFATDVPMVVPNGAEWLIASRLPYLTAAQRREVLRTTALPSGDAMLDKDNWERLNLFAAADGYGAIETDTTVTMIAEQGGFDLYDRWRNDIGGDALLTKAGSGWLDLTGHNSFAGVRVTGGTLRLAGANDFTDTSAVSGGTLIVDGTLAAAAPLKVSGGGTLAGSGRVATAVAIADGTLSPGTDGPGTLTVGALDLAPGARVRFDLNRPGVIGGALNDLVVVDGNLKLDGTLDIAAADGRLAPGVYRLFTYGGTLTDDGLAYGAVPGNVTFNALALDTSNAAQVNLVVDGVTGELAFWNGARTTPNDKVNGGSGTWNATGTNWTNLEGSAAGIWTGMRAVFQGVAGTVAIAGEQTFAGLVFVTDGYRLTAAESGALRTVTAADIQVNSGITALIAAPITGSGGIRKTDGGLLTLTGINSYAGGTTLSGGTLAVSDDRNLGAAGGGLDFDGGVLRVTGTAFTTTARSITWGSRGGGLDIADRAATFTLAQDLTGTGGLLKDGAGTLVLDGRNSFTGGITIAGGRLVGDSDSLTTNITDNAAVTFDQATDGTFAANIGGTGSVTKAGDGTLTVTGSLAQTGGTLVEAGVLRIGAGGTAGAIYNSIVNAGTLIFDRSDDWSFTGTIAGDGDVVKRGAGTLNLTGTSSLTGDTLVEAGVLAVNGSIAGSAVTLRSGTALTGIGRTGSLTAHSGAIVAPGDNAGVGILQVNGDVALEGGSTLAIRIDDEGDNDRLAATGAATIGQGARLTLGGMAPGERYTVLTATGGVAGRFDDLTDTYAFLDAHIAYEPAAVVASLERNATSFASTATTDNGKAAAAGAERLPGGNALLAQLVAATKAEAEAAFATLSGEIYPGTVAVLAREAQHIQSAVIGRLSQSLTVAGRAVGSLIPTAAAGDSDDTRHGAFWTAAYGAFGRYGNDAGADTDTSTAGFLAGADGEVGGWTLGLAGGYARISVESDRSLASADLDNYTLAVYGGRQMGNVALRLGASYAYTAGDGTRTAVLPGGTERLAGEIRASTYQVFGDLGYAIPLRGSVAAEPFVSLSLGRVQSDDIRETGGTAALTIDGASATTGHSTLGVRIGGNRESGEQGFGIGGAIGWRHAYGDTEPTASAIFGDDPASGFTIAGTPIARDALALEAGVEYRLSRRLRLGLRYNGQIAGGADEHGVQANVKVRF
ncbi:autotransporter domain-containing protein [Zavarzinia compransoris]|nr:autotransporter domain-containing protein [Zavarzinia compransoris]TDP48300.1 autotransporter-associated beta strand protein [Zavarzinia compransoris]